MNIRYFKTVLCLVFATFFTLLLVSCEKQEHSFECNDPIGCVTIAPGEPIKIGVLQALSGKVAFLGIGQIRGTELAIAKQEGQLLGHPIELQTEDTKCSEEGGANAALKIVADPQNVAVLGTTCSGAAATASKVISEAGLVMISGNNSAPFLTSIGGERAPYWQPGYFRTASNEEASGETAAMFAFNKLGVTKVATINDGDIYTKGLTDGFKRRFEKLGGEIVLSATINKGDTDMQPVLTAVRDSQAKLLFFPVFQPEGNFITIQAKKIEGLKNIILMSDGALIVSSFVEAVQGDGVGMYFVGPTPYKGPASIALAADYKSKYSESPSTFYYESAFDAANILFTAIEKVAEQKQDGTLHIGRQELRNALYAIKDFDGVTGRLTCDEFGDCAFPIFSILRLDDPTDGIDGLKKNVIYTYSPRQ